MVMEYIGTVAYLDTNNGMQPLHILLDPIILSM